MQQEKEIALVELQLKLDNMETDFEKILHVSAGTAWREVTASSAWKCAIRGKVQRARKEAGKASRLEET